jgi:hypothetical protein
MNFKETLALLQEASNKPSKKQKWMLDYEKALSTRKDYQPGRVCWDSATHAFNSGKTPQDAAKSASDTYKSEKSR